MGRDHPVDIARAICVLYIVGFWHLFENTEMINMMPYGEYFKNAALATFIFISGYFLGKKYLISDIITLRNYFLKRVARLIPLFVLALFSYYVVGFITLKTAILSLTGLSTFFPPQPPTLWFVSMILIFYYLFPLLSGRKILIQILTAISIMGIAFLADNYLLHIDRRFFYYWPSFVTGIILGRSNLAKYFESWLIFIIMLFAFLGFSIIHLHDYGSLPPWLYRMLISITGAFLILSLAHLLAKSSILVKAGSIVSYLSMSAYLFHRQVIDIIEKFIYWPDDGWFRVLYLVMFCLPIILFIGYMVQKIYDLLTRRLLYHSTNVRD